MSDAATVNAANVAATPTLAVSENRRFLVYAEDGRPFFWLGDTAWELFHRLDRGQADAYLSDRAAKGFTVIQAVGLAELDGLRAPNAYGDLPLLDLDPTRPNEPYWRHVDYIVQKAASLGLFIGFLPTWGDKYNKQWGEGPEVFTPENARVFGEFLGRRYADQPVVWVLGGDRPLSAWDHVRVVRAMAEGIRAAVGRKQLITFHPCGQQTSSLYFHCDEWLDFNMYQTGHTFDRDNYRSITEDYRRTPTKPCLDAEPGYEDHPNGWKPETGWLDAYECRKFLYWGLFAGACGHTYGCHDIWQMWDPSRKPISWARTPWDEAMALPGASQMRIAKDLLLARPYLTRVPAQELLASDARTGTEHIRATRDSGGSYALVYSAAGRPFTLDLDKIGGGDGARYRAAWVDPRTGAITDAGEIDGAGEREFAPPSSGRGNDWALALDRI